MPLFLRTFAAALAVFAFASFAHAQGVRLRGTIESVNGETMVVHTRQGETANVHLKAGAPIGALVKAQLSDIKPGLFIGAAAMPGEGDTLKAMEVHIFPETMRGTGEGFRPFDLAPGSSMTNANISSVVDGVSGPKLTLTYKGGEQTVTVDKATPIVTFAPGEPSDLVPGASIEIFGAAKTADGAYEAQRI